MDILSEIAKKYPTDKFGHHNFTPIYNEWLADRYNDSLVLLELGIGGYEYPDRGGGSLKMWRDYFPKAKIHGVDIHDKSFFNEERIVTHVGSQDDAEFLNNLIFNIGIPDVIIDDASHINPLTIDAFNILFQKLKDGGIYFVEDTHTSYWEDIYKGNKDIGRGVPDTTMNYFKMLSDLLNRQHIPGIKQVPWWVEKIKAIHFYPEMIVIEKL